MPLLTMLMTLPCPDSVIGPMKRRNTFRVPKTFTSNIACQSSSPVSRSFTCPWGAKRVSETSPALLMRTSTVPNLPITSE